MLEVKHELSQVIDYGLVIADLKTKVDADLALTIDGVDDKAGYKLCSQRRKEWVKVRTGIDRRRKEMNAAAREHIKQVDSVAAEFTDLAGQAEDHVSKLVDSIDAEVERVKREAADRVFNERNAQLQYVGIDLNRLVIESLDSEQVAAMIAQKVDVDRLKREESERLASAKAETDRLAAEERERHRIAAENLSKERAEFERLKAVQAAEFSKLREEHDAQQRVIDTEKQRLADIEAARIEKEVLQKREVEQAEASRVEAERLRFAAERAAIEAAERLEREQRLSEEARKKEESLRPDREKLLAFSDRVAATLREMPEVSKSMVMLKTRVADVVIRCAKEIRELVAAK